MTRRLETTVTGACQWWGSSHDRLIRANTVFRAVRPMGLDSCEKPAGCTTTVHAGRTWPNSGGRLDQPGVRGRIPGLVAVQETWASVRPTSDMPVGACLAITPSPHAG